MPKLPFQIIPRTVATLSQHQGTVKDTQGSLRDARRATTTYRYMQFIPKGLKQMVESTHDELRKPASGAGKKAKPDLLRNDALISRTKRAKLAPSRRLPAEAFLGQVFDSVREELVDLIGIEPMISFMP
jgi:hypothetical protein